DLSVIRSEYQVLKGSQLLERNSPVDNKLMEIEGALKKYDEITGFISSNRDFSYSNSGLSDRFPMDVVRRIISYATDYRNKQLENPHVNNCSRLHEGLKEIPKSLFHAH